MIIIADNEQKTLVPGKWIRYITSRSREAVAWTLIKMIAVADKNQNYVIKGTSLTVAEVT